MISRLFANRQRIDPLPPEVPAGTRVYAIGDIHGCPRLLRDLHRRITDDSRRRPPARNVVVYLGDYIDRGEDSRGVIDILLDEPLPGFEHVHLRGNHEDSLLGFLDDLLVGPAWLSYGGRETLMSYGVRLPDPVTDQGELRRVQQDLNEKLPDAHRAFLAGLAGAHTEGDYFFVHAGIRPGVPLDRQRLEDLMWIRDDFLRSHLDFGKIVVHGHTVTAQPDLQRNRIGIDTGAFASGRLTCLALEGREWAFIQT